MNECVRPDPFLVYVDLLVRCLGVVLLTPGLPSCSLPAGGGGGGGGGRGDQSAGPGSCAQPARGWVATLEE